MPSYDDPNHHRHHRQHGGRGSPPKPNQKFLSLILKAMIMTFITTLFFLLLGVAAILLILATAALHHRRRSACFTTPNDFCFKDLKKLPQFRYSRRLRPDGDADCVVCLEGVRQGQWCRKLSRCGHLFHRRCVDPWLVKVPACPICRTPVRPQVEALLEDRPLWGSAWRNEFGTW